MTKEIDLEDLIAETEQKILNNEYYEDINVEYRDSIIRVRIRPISQAKFVEISKNKKALGNAEFNSLILHECIINKHDNKPFTLKQINELFTGGLATKLTIECLEISGISLNEIEANNRKKF